MMLQLHELLAFLGSRGVVTIMILAQAGIIVGPVLNEFSGIFTGVPKFLGTDSQIMKNEF